MSLPLLSPLTSGLPAETLTWRTALSISRNGTELRAPTRAHPRLQLSFSYVLDEPNLLALEALRAGGTVLVPLLHAPMTKRPDGIYIPTDNPANPSPYLIRHLESGAYDYVTPDELGRTPAEGTLSASPAYPVHLVGNSSSLSTLTHGTHTSTITVETISPFDRYTPTPLASLGGPGSSSAPTPASPLIAPNFVVHNFTSALNEQRQNDVLSFDAGGISQRVVRYQKRSVSLNVALLSAGEVREFRVFMHQLQGAARQFLWTIPGEAEPRLWRLGSDSVQLQHLSAGVATTSLNLVELPLNEA